MHELGARRDDIFIEVPASFPLGLIKLNLIFPAPLDLLLAQLRLFRVFRRAEAP